MSEALLNELDFDTELAKFTEKQLQAITLLDSGRVKFLLYGGALGGGKSYFLRWYLVRRLIMLAEMGFPGAVVMLACEDYPALKDRQLQKIAVEFPVELGRSHADHKTFGRCFILSPNFGGGVICFRNLDDPSKYQSAEFAAIGVDELTKNPLDVFTMLRSRLRWRGLPDVECQLIGATNPGGVGHGWCKQFWMDRIFPREFLHPVDYSGTFAYVPSLAYDNPHLDPAYYGQLQTLPDHLRKAFAEGDWNIFLGQAFPEFTARTHVIEPYAVRYESVKVYMTFDWGFGKPFSVGWWYVESDDRVIRIMEWYGWSGLADQGLRLPDSDIAAGIIEREKTAGIDKAGKNIIRLAGHDCWNKKPNYNGGGQGPSTQEVFAEHGLYLTKADSNRELKIRAFRERLRTPEDGERPMMLVFSSCDQFIRTIPNLIMDQNNLEDVETAGEDHIYDEACHICMARPLAMDQKKPRETVLDKMLNRLTSPVATGSGSERHLVENVVMRGSFGGYLDEDNDVDDDFPNNYTGMKPTFRGRRGGMV